MSLTKVKDFDWQRDCSFCGQADGAHHECCPGTLNYTHPSRESYRQGWDDAVAKRGMPHVFDGYYELGYSEGKAYGFIRPEPD